MLRPYKKSVKFIMLLLVFCLFPGKILAQTMDTPVLLQVATFVKVFKYDNMLKDKDPNLLIVYNNSNRRTKDELTQAFRDASVRVEAMLLEELNTEIQNYDVIYIMPGVKSAADLCKQHKKLSISGISRYVEEGTVSVALGLLNDKPRLYVNLKSLQQEGHTLSAQLLQVVRVF